MLRSVRFCLSINIGLNKYKRAWAVALGLLEADGVFLLALMVKSILIAMHYLSAKLSRLSVQLTGSAER